MRKINIDIFLVNLLLFLLPLIYLSGFGSYNTPKYFFFSIIILILLIFTVYRFLKNEWLLKSFFKKWYNYGIIIYLISFLIVSMTSVDPALSFFSSFSKTDGAFIFLYLTIFSLSIYSILSLSSSKDRIIKQLLYSSVISAVILSLLIFLSKEGFSILKWDWLSRSGGGGTVGNQSFAGAYILWNIFFAVILFFKANSFKSRILPFLFFLILTFSPLFINWNLLLGKIEYSGIMSLIGLARGALLGLAFGFFLTIGMFLSLNKNKLKKYFGLVIIFIILSGVIGGSFSLVNKTSVLHQKFIQIAGENRFIFWDSAIEGFKEKPILGWGPNTFGYSFHKFFNPQLLSKENNFEAAVSRSHNIFVETLNGGGILLFLALIFLVFSIVYGFIDLYKNKKLSGYEVSLIIGALFAWLIQNQFVFDTILSLLMLFLTIGILIGYSVEEINNKQKYKIIFLAKHKVIFIFIIIITILLLIFTVILPYKKNDIMYRTYKTKLPQRAYLWKNFLGVSPMGDSYDMVWIFSNLYKTYYKARGEIQSFDKQKKEIILKELDEIIKYLTELVKNSNDYDLILVTSKIYYLRMYIAKDISQPLYDKAQELIKKAITLSPNDPQPYWTKAQLETAKGDFSEAKNSLEKAVSLAPWIPLTHGFILELAKKSNNQAYYDFALKRAKEIPNIIKQLNESNDI